VDEKTRRVKVHAEFDNSDGRLRPNDFGIGRIFIREEPKALVVPSEAVQSDGGSSVVFVRTSDNKSFGVRPVHTGLRDGNVVEVRGVQAGEEVATTGSFALLSELLKERIIAGD
jgi:multidrug efflux system membrane fusion protein